jgi:hypothetical protein
MNRTLRPIALLAGAVLLALTLTPADAHAQFRPGGRMPSTVGLQSYLAWNRVNPNYYLPNGMTLNQYAYTMATLGRAYSYIPPYTLGYNPYPQVVNYGPVYPVYQPYVPYNYTPYYSYNPYLAGYGVLTPYGF